MRWGGGPPAPGDPPTTPQPVLDEEALDAMAVATAEGDDAGLSIVSGSRRWSAGAGPEGASSLRVHDGLPRSAHVSVLPQEGPGADGSAWADGAEQDWGATPDDLGEPEAVEHSPETVGVPDDVVRGSVARPAAVTAGAVPEERDDEAVGSGETLRVLAGGVLAVLAVVGLLALLVVLRGSGVGAEPDQADVVDAPAVTEDLAGLPAADGDPGDDVPADVPAAVVDDADTSDDASTSTTESSGAGGAVAQDEASEDQVADGAAEEGPEAAADGEPSVTVLNNSRVSGLAARTAAALEVGGWEVAETGNVGGRTPATTVYHADGLEAEARRLASELGGARVAPRPSDLAGEGDLVVVLTRDRA